MEKVKTFLFYHGEKVGLVAALAVCLAVLVAAQPWDTSIAEAELLQQELQQLASEVGRGEPKFDEPDMIDALNKDIGPPENIQPLDDGHLIVFDTRGPLSPRGLYPRVAPVDNLTVTPERGRIKLSWTIDPAKQAAESDKAGYTGVIELLRAVVYRAPADAVDTLAPLATVELSDVVVMPPGTSLVGPSLPMRPTFDPGARPAAFGAPPPELPEGKVSVEEAAAAERFVYADPAVEPDRDYVYKVQLVAKNPLFEPTSAQDVPEFIESDLVMTPVSLAQRALPSIRWFFIGGASAAAQVKVYKWHVFSLPAAELGEKLTAAETASGQETVERADWVGVTFPVVRPGDRIGREEKRWFTVPGTTDVRQQLTIDFSTGATVVAVESAPRIEYVAGAGEAATNQIVSEKLLLYYRDAQGPLQTRWQESDLVLREREVQLAAERGVGEPVLEEPGEAGAGLVEYSREWIRMRERQAARWREQDERMRQRARRESEESYRRMEQLHREDY